MSIKAVLFDFDGTLINTNELCFESYRHAFRAVQNREIEMPEILNLFGRPLHVSLGEYGDDYEALYKTYRKFNEEHYDALVKKFDGVTEGVEKISRKNLKIAVVTSKRRRMCEVGLRWLGIDGYIDVLVTPEDTDKYKPDPAPFLLACKKLGVKPQDTVTVGDSPFDMRAGKAAGTKLCAVKYSAAPHDELKKIGLDYFVDSIEELADAL